MRIRLLSGNQKGDIVDMPGADLLVSNGLAEPVRDEVVTALAPVAPEPDAEGANLAEPDESDDASTEPDPPGVTKARVRRPRPATTPSHGKRR